MGYRSSLLIAMNLLLIAILFTTSLLVFLAESFPSFHTNLLHFFSRSSLSLQNLAGLFFLFSFLCFALSFRWTRPRYYLFKMGGKNRASLSETALSSTLQIYWKRAFPEENISFQVQVFHQKIEVWATLPFTEQGKQKALLEKIEEELSEVFADLLNYRDEFTLVANFASQ